MIAPTIAQVIKLSDSDRVFGVNAPAILPITAPITPATFSRPLSIIQTFLLKSYLCRCSPNFTFSSCQTQFGNFLICPAPILFFSRYKSVGSEADKRQTFAKKPLQVQFITYIILNG
jgi:hypothetical protein